IVPTSRPYVRIRPSTLPKKSRWACPTDGTNAIIAMTKMTARFFTSSDIGPPLHSIHSLQIRVASGTLPRSTQTKMKRATSSPEILIRLMPNSDASLRLQVEGGLRQAIHTGRLAAGTLLPATRVLAGDLGISRGVVIEAYEQLLAEGYLTARRGSATRVARRCTESMASPDMEPVSMTVPRYDFRPGVPDPALFPRRAWLISMRRGVEAAPSDAFDYPDPRGIESTRTELAIYLNRARATVTRPDR